MGGEYEKIQKLEKSADEANKNVNEHKKEILNKSYTIAYFENLMMLAYKEIYDAIVSENYSIDNNTKMRSDNYSIDKTTIIYQNEKIQFYKSINTFLFYTYYMFLLIIISFMVMKLNIFNTINNIIFINIIVVSSYLFSSI